MVANTQSKKKSPDVPAAQIRTAPRVLRPGTRHRGHSTNIARVARTPEMASSSGWHLMTRNPPACSRCRHHVNPEFVEIRVDRKVWVFCSKYCRLKWDAEHPSI